MRGRSERAQATNPVGHSHKDPPPQKKTRRRETAPTPNCALSARKDPAQLPRSPRDFPWNLLRVKLLGATPCYLRRNSLHDDVMPTVAVVARNTRNTGHQHAANEGPQLPPGIGRCVLTTLRLGACVRLPPRGHVPSARAFSTVTKYVPTFTCVPISACFGADAMAEAFFAVEAAAFFSLANMTAVWVLTRYHHIHTVKPFRLVTDTTTLPLPFPSPASPFQLASAAVCSVITITRYVIKQGRMKV